MENKEITEQEDSVVVQTWWCRLGAKWKFLYLLPQSKHPRAVSHFARKTVKLPKSVHLGKDD